MSDDFDVELRRRLTGLAAAAPIEGAGDLTRVPSRVRPRRAAALLPSGVLVAVAVLAVIGAALSGGVGLRGTLSPSTSTSASASTPTSEAASPNSGPVASSEVDGAFELMLRSAKAHYVTSEPINVEASLTYRGPEAAVTICHDVPGPIVFGIRERVLGIDLTPSSLLMFDHSTLTRDLPLTKPFAKSGTFSSDDPAAPSMRAFFADPILRLPAGTWHIYAQAGSCSPAPLKFALEVEIEITVQ